MWPFHRALITYPLPAISTALPGIEMRRPRLQQVGETDGQISCCNNEVGSHSRQSGLLHHSEQQAQVGVAELRADRTGYRKDDIDTKIPSLREQRHTKPLPNQKSMNTLLCLLSPQERTCNICLCFSIRKAGKWTPAWLGVTWSCRLCQRPRLQQLRAPNHCKAQGCCRSWAPVEQRQRTSASLESGDEDSKYESCVCTSLLKNNYSIYPRTADYRNCLIQHWKTTSRVAEQRNRQPT